MNALINYVIADALDLFERNEAAKAEFLARIPLRYVPVNSGTARKVARYRKHLYDKSGHTGFTAQQFVDDAINRAIDRAEAKQRRKR